MQHGRIALKRGTTVRLPRSTSATRRKSSLPGSQLINFGLAVLWSARPYGRAAGRRRTRRRIPLEVWNGSCECREHHAERLSRTEGAIKALHHRGMQTLQRQLLAAEAQSSQVLLLRA